MAIVECLFENPQWPYLAKVGDQVQCECPKHQYAREVSAMALVPTHLVTPGEGAVPPPAHKIGETGPKVREGEYDVVDRPTHRATGRNYSPWPIDAVISTAKTGKSIRLWVGEHETKAINSIRESVKKRGYRLIWDREEEQTVLCWCEKWEAGKK